MNTENNIMRSLASHTLLYIALARECGLLARLSATVSVHSPGLQSSLQYVSLTRGRNTNLMVAIAAAFVSSVGKPLAVHSAR